MQLDILAPVVFIVSLIGITLPLWVGPRLNRRIEEQQLSLLARMERFARRHNTFVRNCNSVRWVVVLGQNGFHYMIGGKFVSRDQLIKTLGTQHERLITKAEEEEQRHGPTPTFRTQPA